MAAAHPIPRFDPDGAPISLLVDFDGTISLHDVGDTLLARHAPDPAEVARIDRLYDEGRVGSRELVAWDIEVLPSDPDLLLREATAIPMDETFTDLVRTVRDIGGAVEIVSDGIGFHVEPMLARLGLSDLPVATNATEPGRGGAGVTFPYGHPACFVCGTCKRERVRRHQEAGRAVVFVGDGTSDRYAAHHADVVLAKASLAAWCQAEQVPYEPWRRLADVADWIASALTDGRLPADRAAYLDWAARYRANEVAFICGPESSGVGGVAPIASIGAPTHRVQAGRGTRACADGSSCLG